MESKGAIPQCELQLLRSPCRTSEQLQAERCRTFDKRSGGPRAGLHKRHPLFNPYGGPHMKARLFYIVTVLAMVFQVAGAGWRR